MSEIAEMFNRYRSAIKESELVFAGQITVGLTPHTASSKFHITSPRTDSTGRIQIGDYDGVPLFIKITTESIKVFTDPIHYKIYRAWLPYDFGNPKNNIPNLTEYTRISKASEIELRPHLTNTDSWDVLVYMIIKVMKSHIRRRKLYISKETASHLRADKQFVDLQHK